MASHVLFSNVTTSLNYNDWRVSDLCISSYAHHTLSRVTRVRVGVQPWIEPVLVLVDRSSFIDLFITREVSRDFYQSSTYCWVVWLARQPVLGGLTNKIAILEGTISRGVFWVSGIWSLDYETPQTIEKACKWCRMKARKVVLAFHSWLNKRSTSMTRPSKWRPCLPLFPNSMKLQQHATATQSPVSIEKPQPKETSCATQSTPPTPKQKRKKPNSATPHTKAAQSPPSILPTKSDPQQIINTSPPSSPSVTVLRP